MAAQGVHKITEQFEQELCKYTGAPYAVAVDNQSNALFLALMFENVKGKTIIIPSHTYPSVPCEIIHAGAKVDFYKSNKELMGAYNLLGSNVWDSALRFTADMYLPSTHMCLSFTGPYKHLKLGKGGAILTDNKEAYEWFKRARFSGRRELSYHEDDLTMLGWNFYMMPEIAARGLLLMSQFYNADASKKHNDDLTLPYPDLSNRPIYRPHLLQKPKIYISGPITGQEDTAEARFENSEKLLLEYGWDVVNPMKLNHDNHDKSWESFMKVDLKAMMECDAIYMMREWQGSKGAIMERDIAKKLKMKIIMFSDSLYKKHSESWQK